MCLVLSKLWMVGKSVSEPRSNLLSVMLYYYSLPVLDIFPFYACFHMQGSETKIFKLIFRGDESDQSSCALAET